jgi:hypothetical protein
MIERAYQPKFARQNLCLMTGRRIGIFGLNYGETRPLWILKNAEFSNITGLGAGHDNRRAE